MPTGLVFFPAFDWAITPTHPEREERLLYTRDQLFEEGIMDLPELIEYKPRMAQKKDIARVFNAETFLIGAVSGLIGILTASFLTIPVNNILERLTTLEDLAQLDIRHAILLALVSILLTMAGGYLPAGMAANKDPVKALRSE